MGTTTVSRWTLALALAVFAGAMTCASPALAASRATTRVNLTNARIEAAEDSLMPSVSQDGRFVAFASFASTLTPGATDFHSDVFLRDRLAGTTMLVSRTASGAPGNDASAADFGPTVSADGRFVVFDSDASDLVPGDANGSRDVFVYEVATGAVTRVSVDSSQGEGNGSSMHPRISADGRYVVFTSEASDLTDGDTNARADVFLRDRQLNTTVLVSVATGGAIGDRDSGEPSVSDDGRRVAFSSDARNLVPGDTNGVSDVFLRDTVSSETTRLSVDSGEVQGDGQSASPSISADGQFVALVSVATNLVPADSNDAADVFVRDLEGGLTFCASVTGAGAPGAGESLAPSISREGSAVAFASSAPDLVSHDTNGDFDVFVRNLTTGSTLLVSASSTGEQGATRSSAPAISADGLSVAFESDAANLVTPDRNHRTDIFVNEAPRAPVVGNPIAPSTMRRLKYYTVYGYLRPWHAAGTYPVRIYMERYVSGTWKRYGSGYVNAKASDRGTYTKYARSIRLPYTGRWRLRALAPADTGHISVWSWYDYVTVK